MVLRTLIYKEDTSGGEDISQFLTAENGRIPENREPLPLKGQLQLDEVSFDCTAVEDYHAVLCNVWEEPDLAGSGVLF